MTDASSMHGTSASGDIRFATKQNEDLKAFERRLTEILACYQPQTKRWRIILLIVTLSTSISASQWLLDPETERVSFFESLRIHRKVVAPAIIVSRIRSVLENFNMSCDRNGRLILKRSMTHELPNKLIAEGGK